MVASMIDKSFGSTSVTEYSQAPSRILVLYELSPSRMPLLLTYFTTQTTVLNIRQMPMPRHIRLIFGAVVEKC